MRNIPVALQNHLSQEVISPAYCLKITQKSGRIIAITDHDRDIDINGDIYSAGVTFNMSAIKSSMDFSIDNMEIEMALDGVFLIKDDVLNDELYEADFELLLVNWQNLNDGYVVLKRGVVGEIEITDEFFVKIQLKGLLQKLSRSFLETYSPTCRANFGDVRCGFANLPTRVRSTNKRYITSDWFLVPRTAIVPAIANMSFEANGLTAGPFSDWIVGSGSSWTTIASSLNGSYALAGGASTGEINTIYKELSTSSLGLAGVDIDAGTYSAMFSAAMRNTSVTPDRNVCQIKLLFLDINKKTVGSQSTPLTVKDLVVWDTDQIVTYIPPKTRFMRLVCVAYKSQGTVASSAFDDLKFEIYTNNMSTWGGVMYKVARIPSYSPNSRVALENSVFDVQGLVGSGLANITKWTQAGPFYTSTNVGPFNDGGKLFLVGGDDLSGVQKTYTLTQTKPLTALTANINSGFIKMRASLRAGLQHAAAVVHFTLEYLSAANAVLATHTYTPVFNVLGFTTVTDDTRIVPINSKNVRITLKMTSPPGTSVANAVISTVELLQIDLNSTDVNDADSGSVANTVPGGYAGGVGLNNTLADGQLLMQEKPVVFNYGQIDALDTKKSFVSSAAATVLTATNAFNGRVVWLSGANAGKTSLIRKFDVGTNMITLYDNLSGLMVTGDKCIISRGCDKTIDTCKALSNNFNFRGEPYLPGPDQVIAYFTTT